MAQPQLSERAHTELHSTSSAFFVQPIARELSWAGVIKNRSVRRHEFMTIVFNREGIMLLLTTDAFSLS